MKKLKPIHWATIIVSAIVLICFIITMSALADISVAATDAEFDTAMSKVLFPAMITGLGTPAVIVLVIIVIVDFIKNKKSKNQNLATNVATIVSEPKASAKTETKVVEVEDKKEENEVEEEKKSIFGFFKKQSSNEVNEEINDTKIKVNEVKQEEIDYSGYDIMELVDMYDKKLAAVLKSMTDQTANEAISVKKALQDKVNALPVVEKSKYSNLVLSFQNFENFENLYPQLKLMKDATSANAFKMSAETIIKGAQSTLLMFIKDIS